MDIIQMVLTLIRATRKTTLNCMPAIFVCLVPNVHCKRSQQLRTICTCVTDYTHKFVWYTSQMLLFDLILYVPSTIFQFNRDWSSWVEPVLRKDKCVLLKDHNAVTLVRLEPAAPQALYHWATALPHFSNKMGLVCHNHWFFAWEMLLT